MGTIGIILLIIMAAFIGCVLGVLAVAVFNKISRIRMSKDAKRIKEGLKKNKYELDGKLIDVNPFQESKQEVKMNKEKIVKKSLTAPKNAQIK